MESLFKCLAGTVTWLLPPPPPRAHAQQGSSDRSYPSVVVAVVESELDATKKTASSKVLGVDA